MTDWDCMIVAERLKEKQTAMQESHTRIVDALNGARDELTALRGKWKGSASDEFFAFVTSQNPLPELVSPVSSDVSDEKKLT